MLVLAVAGNGDGAGRRGCGGVLAAVVPLLVLLLAAVLHVNFTSHEIWQARRMLSGSKKY